MWPSRCQSRTLWSSEPEASQSSSDQATEPTLAMWPFRSLGLPPLVGRTRTTPLFDPMASQAGAASGPELWGGCDHASDTTALPAFGRDSPSSPLDARISIFGSVKPPPKASRRSADQARGGSLLFPLG